MKTRGSWPFVLCRAELPRALDGELPSTEGTHFCWPPCLPPCLRLEDDRSHLRRASAPPQQGDAYLESRVTAKCLPNLRIQTGKPLPLAKVRISQILHKAAGHQESYLKALSLNIYIYFYI